MAVLYDYLPRVKELQLEIAKLQGYYKRHKFMTKDEARYVASLKAELRTFRRPLKSTGLRP